MPWRKLLVALAGLAVVGVEWSSCGSMPDPAARTTVANCNRIRLGVSRAEAEGILWRLKRLWHRWFP